MCVGITLTPTFIFICLEMLGTFKLVDTVYETTAFLIMTPRIYWVNTDFCIEVNPMCYQQLYGLKKQLSIEISAIDVNQQSFL